MFVEHCGDDTTFTKELVFRTRVNICQMEKVKLLLLFFFHLMESTETSTCF